MDLRLVEFSSSTFFILDVDEMPRKSRSFAPKHSIPHRVGEFFGDRTIYLESWGLFLSVGTWAPALAGLIGAFLTVVLTGNLYASGFSGALGVGVVAGLFLRARRKHDTLADLSGTARYAASDPRHFSFAPPGCDTSHLAGARDSLRVLTLIDDPDARMILLAEEPDAQEMMRLLVRSRRLPASIAEGKRHLRDLDKGDPVRASVEGEIAYLEGELDRVNDELKWMRQVRQIEDDSEMSLDRQEEAQKWLDREKDE